MDYGSGSEKRKKSKDKKKEKKKHPYRTGGGKRTANTSKDKKSGPSK